MVLPHLLSSCLVFVYLLSTPSALNLQPAVNIDDSPVLLAKATLASDHGSASESYNDAAVGKVANTSKVDEEHPIPIEIAIGATYHPLGIGIAVALICMLPVTVFVMYRSRMFSSDKELTTNRYSPFAIFALAGYSALLMTSDIVANYIAQTNGGHYPWNPILAVFVVECSKCLVSALLFCGDLCTAAGSAPHQSEQRVETSTPAMLVKGSLSLIPTACLYAFNNCMNLFVLSKMHLDSFVIFRNMGILFNAIIWSQYFKKVLGVHQMLGILGMFVGCCLSNIQLDGSLGSVDWPVLLVILTALVSALGAVCNEGVLKSEAFHRISFNAMNTILYVETAAVLGIALLVHSQLSGADTNTFDFRSIDHHCLLYISIQMTLGLCVSRVLKYADSVAKVVAGGVREIMTLLVAPFFVVSRLDWISLSSGCWVLFAVVTYFAAGNPSSKHKDKEVRA